MKPITIGLSPICKNDDGRLSESQSSFGQARDEPKDIYLPSISDRKIVARKSDRQENIMTPPKSAVDQIMELRESCTPTEVDKLGKVMRVLPRTIALALIFNEGGKILVDPGFDASKNEKFYRLLGGGVDFSEPSDKAVVREIKEETGIDAVAYDRLGVFENIFTFEGKSFHEIVIVYRVNFCVQADYDRAEILVSDTSRKSTTATWKSLDEIKQEGAKLYPEGLEALMKQA